MAEPSDRAARAASAADSAALARSLRESEDVFRELADHLEQCVWVKDATTAITGRMVYVSPAFERIFGVPPERFHGDPDLLYQLVHPEDLSVFREAITRQFERRYDIEYRVVLPDGAIRWLWSRASQVRDAEGRVIKLVGITEDITPRKEAEHRIRKLNAELERLYRLEQALGRTDELTGIGNRHRYAEESEKLWKLIRREAQKHAAPRHLAAILLDVDHLKQINDGHGHAAGDACLRAVGGAISAAVRDIDVAARLGGDEFIVLLPYATLAEARQVAERIREALAAKPVTQTAEGGAELTIALGASLGVSAIDGRDDDASVEQLYAAADRALYAAKAAGRGRVADRGA